MVRLVILRKKNIDILKNIRDVLSVVGHTADDLKYGDRKINVGIKIIEILLL